MHEQDHFLFFTNCIPVKGAGRSIICDLHRERYVLIPNGLYEIVTLHKDKTIGEIKEHYHHESDDVVDEYFSFLEQGEFIYYCDAAFREHFPAMEPSWKYPAYITNAIFDCNAIPWYITREFVQELGHLGCLHIQLRFFKQISLMEFAEKICPFFYGSGINTLSLYLPYKEISMEVVKAFICSNQFISGIIFYNAPANDVAIIQGHLITTIIYSDKNLDSEQHCGAVKEGYFAANMPHYTESLHHNTCLNRKISIDTDGNIKNCPSMKESFGNIKATTLEEALNKPGFKKYWNITKDQVSVCKDCEFRHVCTDCRAYLEIPEDEYSKPLKCGYDPYTCTWEEWSTHPLKQQAIIHYGFSMP